MNPLEWGGQQFLAFYLPVVLISFVALFSWKRWLNQPGGPPAAMHLDLDAYQVAALCGDQQAVHAAVLALTHAGTLRVSDDGDLVIADDLPPRARPLEHAVHGAVLRQEHSPRQLLQAARPALAQLHDSLRALGLLRSAEQDARYRGLPSRVFLAVLGLGVAKLALGVLRERPVGYLVMVLLAGAAAWWLLRENEWASRRGNEVLAALRARHRPLATTARSEGSAEAMRPMEVALAASLFGMGTLALLRDHPLRDYLLPHEGRWGGGASSSSSGGGGSDSGGSDSGWGGGSDSGGSDSGGSDSGGSDSGGSCGGGGCGGCGGGGGGD